MSTKPRTFFRGQELPRLLVLLIVLIFGSAYFFHFFSSRSGPAAEPVLRADAAPAPVVPDVAPEFESVTDRTPLGIRDMAAYVNLLKRSEAAPPADLAAQSRRDVVFAHLWGNPQHYRGVPIHLLGTAHEVLRYDSKRSRTGWIYEAWITTPDSRPNPYVCVFEEPPKGFPLGPNISERVVFDGYFLKLMEYEAHDVRRGAPLLIGRLGWTPSPAPRAGDPVKQPVFWLALAVGVMFVISLIRWIAGLRRSLTARPRSALLTREPPNEEITPEALESWVDSVAREGEADIGPINPPPESGPMPRP